MDQWKKNTSLANGVCCSKTSRLQISELSASTGANEAGCPPLLCTLTPPAQLSACIACNTAGPPPFPFPRSGLSTNPLFSTVLGHVRAARPRSSHASISADRGGTGSPASSGLTPARALVWRRERCTKECSGTPRHYKTARTLLNKTAMLIKSG